MERPEISQYTTLDFVGWNEDGALILTPKFQRRDVWKTPARSYFIDSLLRDVPIPPIFIRLTQSPDRRRVIREVIDGQQRLRALLDFYGNKYALSKAVENVGGKRFSQLSDEQQKQIERSSFLCEVSKSIADEDVLEVFARVNTYSVGLNAQELRNGKYFGLFDEKSLGPDHPAVARDLNNLAALYVSQGQCAKADPLYERALTIYEKALGTEHPDVSAYLERYALCLRNMGRSQEAEPLEARARAIRVKSA